ncbi:hypothetical protein Tco_0419068 [Tanacetum coccineum]
MRMASAAAKPCHRDSFEFYLIAGSINTDKRRTVVIPMVAAAGLRQVRFIATCSYSTDIDDLGNTDEQPNVQAASKQDWFKKPARPLTPDPK